MIEENTTRFWIAVDKAQQVVDIVPTLPEDDKLPEGIVYCSATKRVAERYALAIRRGGGRTTADEQLGLK